MRSVHVFACLIAGTACAGSGGGGAGTAGSLAEGKIVAYRAKSGDVDPAGNYRVQLTGPHGRRDAELSIWLKPDGTGYAATMRLEGQIALDSLSVRVDGKRVRLEVRADDAWARRNTLVGFTSTASGRGAPDVSITPPILILLFDGTDFTGTWRGQNTEDTVVGRKLAEGGPEE